MAAQTVAELPRMHRRYIDEIVPALVAEFRYLNAMQVPSIEKVVINIGLGEAITNARAIDAAIIDLKLITARRRSSSAPRSRWRRSSCAKECPSVSK
jgi:ribosomal protein L5